jgi:hypothetical protein
MRPSRLKSEVVSVRLVLLHYIFSLSLTKVLLLTVNYLFPWKYMEEHVLK